MKKDTIPQYITRVGLEKAKRRLELTNEEMEKKLLETRGAIHENFAVEQAKRDVIVIAARIANLEKATKNPIIIDDLNISDEEIGIGNWVKIRDEETKEIEFYTIVGTFDVNVDDGFISWLSPLGKALIGKKQGERVRLTVSDDYQTNFKVLEIGISFGSNSISPNKKRLES